MRIKSTFTKYLVCFLGAGILLFACEMQEQRPPRAPSIPVTSGDFIRVEKSKGTLTVYHDSKLIKRYKIALGSDPQGHKTCEGDGKTPEGLYHISTKNPQSRYHRSLKISYPNQKDRESAKARGTSPGGDIMIHGLPKAFSWLGDTHILKNWTKGCVAVTNEEIEEIFDVIPVGTPIEIMP